MSAQVLAPEQEIKKYFNCRQGLFVLQTDVFQGPSFFSWSLSILKPISVVTGNDKKESDVSKRYRTAETLMRQVIDYVCPVCQRVVSLSCAVPDNLVGSQHEFIEWLNDSLNGSVLTTCTKAYIKSYRLFQFSVSFSKF